MASSSSRLPLVNSYACAFLILLASTKNATGCYTSLFGFGDSLTDTGNLLRMDPPDDPPLAGFPPYGETFFHVPTGRSCDGRIIIDFMAEYYGLPLVPPNFELKNEKIADFRQGVNFAVIGATALNLSFYEERGIHNPLTNVSLEVQLGWFKEILPSLCDSSSSCSEFFHSSLFLFGPFGGNDYYRSLNSDVSRDEVQSFVPLITKAIGSAINELIDLGAVTLVVPGLTPLGCLAGYITDFGTSNETEYDSMGCLIWLNEFAEHHNELLQRELNEIRELHPRATIIYADYYNAVMPLYHSPQKYGFMRGAIVVCCGTGGGRYNFNHSAECGSRPFLGCDDPSLYVDWDGYHLTEAAYSLVSKNLLDGPYTIPQINSPCVSLPVLADSSFDR